MEQASNNDINRFTIVAARTPKKVITPEEKLELRKTGSS